MFLTQSLSIKTNEKGFVYKCKLILRSLTSVVHLKIKNERYFLQNGFKYRESLQLHLKKCRHQS